MTNSTKKDGYLMEDGKTEHPVAPDGGSPSEKSRLHAATAIQSSVTPQDYPREKREEQVKAATDGGDPPKP